MNNIIYKSHSFVIALLVFYPLVTQALGYPLPLFIPIYTFSVFTLILIWSYCKNYYYLFIDINWAALLLTLLTVVSIVFLLKSDGLDGGLFIKTVLFLILLSVTPYQLLLSSYKILRVIATVTAPILIFFLLIGVFSDNAYRLFGVSLHDNYNAAAFSALFISYLVQSKYILYEYLVKSSFLTYAVMSGSKKFAIVGIFLIIVDVFIKSKVRLFIAIMLVLIVPLLLFQSEIMEVVRFDNYLDRLYRVDESISKRADRIFYHISNIEYAPFFGMGDSSYSAHNMIIQAWSEGGVINFIISLLVLLALVFVPIKLGYELFPLSILTIVFLMFGDHYYWDRYVTLYIVSLLPISYFYNSNKSH